MSNQLRGEVSLTGESGTSYTLRLGTNALANMQELFGEPTIKQLLDRLSKELNGGDFSVTNIRKMVVASSVSALTELEAGDLLDDCGWKETLSAITKSLGDTLRVRPRKGSAKTRTNSSGS